MTSLEGGGHCLADVAAAARRRRDSFVVRNAVLAERLDRPLTETATAAGAGRYASDRAVLHAGAPLTIGAGLEAAFRYDWFPHEVWGAWSAAERAELHLALREDVALPARLRFEFCALIAGGQVRRGRLRSHVGELAVAEFARPDAVVGMDVEITETDLSAGRELDMVVEVDSLVSPAAATGANDDRLLGLGLIRVSIVGLAPDVPRNAILRQRRRLGNLVRRARTRLRERGLVRGGAHLVRAALRRLF